MNRRRLAWVAGAALTLVLLAPAPVDAYPSGSRASVTDPSQTQIVQHGGSATYFSLLLPKQAHCAGDARHDGYRVFSYLIPRGVDPHTESFVTTLPSKWYGMYTESQYYMGFPAPGTGAIDDIPNNFVWSRLSPSLLLSSGQDVAQWDAGLACVSDHYAIQNTWSATFEFQRSSTDVGGFTWQVISPAGAKPRSQSLAGWAIILFTAAGAFLAVALLFGWLGRRGGGASNPSDPSQGATGPLNQPSRDDATGVDEARTVTASGD